MRRHTWTVPCVTVVQASMAMNAVARDNRYGQQHQNSTSSLTWSLSLRAIHSMYMHCQHYGPRSNCYTWQNLPLWGFGYLQWSDNKTINRIFSFFLWKFVFADVEISEFDTSRICIEDVIIPAQIYPIVRWAMGGGWRWVSTALKGTSYIKNQKNNAPLSKEKKPMYSPMRHPYGSNTHISISPHDCTDGRLAKRIHTAQ